MNNVRTAKIATGDISRATAAIGSLKVIQVGPHWTTIETSDDDRAKLRAAHGFHFCD